MNVRTELAEGKKSDLYQKQDVENRDRVWSERVW
jgi:hypothetical protein